MRFLLRLKSTELLVSVGLVPALSKQEGSSIHCLPIISFIARFKCVIQRVSFLLRLKFVIYGFQRVRFLLRLGDWRLPFQWVGFLLRSTSTKLQFSAGFFPAAAYNRYLAFSAVFFPAAHMNLGNAVCSVCVSCCGLKRQSCLFQYVWFLLCLSKKVRKFIAYLLFLL